MKLPQVLIDACEVPDKNIDYSFCMEEAQETYVQCRTHCQPEDSACLVSCNREYRLGTELERKHYIDFVTDFLYHY